MKRDSKRQRTILVVDDNAEVVDLLRLGLEQSGFEIATAGDGLTALKHARARVPDLILLDLVLPELDGFSVCEALRRERETAHIPIILLTGLSSELNRYAGLGCGANDYLAKPVDLKKLVTRINALLNAAEPSAPSTPAASVNAPNTNLAT